MAFGVINNRYMTGISRRMMICRSLTLCPSVCLSSSLPTNPPILKIPQFLVYKYGSSSAAPRQTGAVAGWRVCLCLRTEALRVICEIITEFFWYQTGQRHTTNDVGRGQHLLAVEWWWWWFGLSSLLLVLLLLLPPLYAKWWPSL